MHVGQKEHTDEFRGRLDRALANPQLRENPITFQQGWRSARDRAASEIDFPTSRRRLTDAKLLDELADLPAESLANVTPRAIAYHDSCQGLNALGLDRAPRRILGEILGHEVRDLAEPGMCCGFSGSFSFDFPAVSERLMNRKLDDAESTGATEVITDNQGCILQLRGGGDAQGRPLRLRHIAELVAEVIEATAARLAENCSPAARVAPGRTDDGLVPI